MGERNVAANAGRLGAVVVNTEELIAAFRRNRDEADGREHVLRVSPPFEGAVRAELHATDDAAETDRSPLDLSPELFVANYRGEDPERTTVRIPTRADARRAARTDHGDGVDEATVEEYLQREMDVWENCVHDSVLDEVRVDHDRESGTETWVDVRYVDDER